MNITGQNGIWARQFSCLRDDCKICISDEWVIWDDDIQMLRPKCNHPLSGPWEFFPFVARGTKRKRKKNVTSEDTRRKKKQKKN